MKLFRFLLLLSFLLTACATPSQTSEVSPTSSLTPTKTKTSTQKPTATQTEAPLSPREQEFLDQGFDKLGSLEEGVIYGILDESSVKYMKDGGIKVERDGQTGYALSTVEVTYYNPETKKFEKGRFIMDWSVTTMTGSYATYPVDAGTANGSSDVISQGLVKNFREQYFAFTPGKSPFVKIMFDYTVPSVDPINKFLAEAFPEFKGKIQVVDIPGVGKVLTVKGVVPEGYPGW